MPEIQLTEGEERAWSVFRTLLGYKDNALATGQELERERQKNLSLQSEMKRVIANCDRRIQENERHCSERLQAAEKRIAVLEDDLEETTRELTEVTTRAYIITEAAQELQAAAAASRHVAKLPRQTTGEDIKRGMERELFGAKGNGGAHVPPVAEMRPRDNMLAKFVDDHEDEEIPAVLLRGPMKPEEREAANKSNDPLARLASMLSPKTAPEYGDQTASEIMEGERR